MYALLNNSESSKFDLYLPGQFVASLHYTIDADENSMMFIYCTSCVRVGDADPVEHDEEQCGARWMPDDVNGPVVSGQYRAFDVRHVVASPRAVLESLGFEARTGPDEGIAELVTAPLRDR